MRFHHFHFHPHSRHGGGGRGPWGRHRHGHHDHHHGGPEDRERGEIKRLLAHGDLRFVVLLLIEEAPRHGYEIIKLIESKSSGQYAPSPGVIYPTLTYLEDTGWISAKTTDDNKRQFSITKDGKAHLDENREAATAILKRLEQLGKEKAEAAEEPFSREDMHELREAFHAIRWELKSFRFASKKTLKGIAEILKRTIEDIKKLKENE